MKKTQHKCRGGGKPSPPVGGLPPSGGDEQHQRAVEVLLVAQVPVLAVPGPVGQIAGEVLGEAFVPLGPYEPPRGGAPATSWIQEPLRPPVVRLPEAVGAVQRDRHVERLPAAQD